jgi:uncharacterized protein YkwD
MLVCGACATAPTPAVAASHHARTGASSSCAKGSARVSRASRRCHTHAYAPRTRAGKLARPHHTRTPKTRLRRSAATSGSGAGVPTTVATGVSATAHAATIAAVLASACQNTELTPEAANIALVRAAVLCLINHKRAENGDSPLKLNPQLEAAAEGHCQEMIAEDYFAHVAPGGETPVDRIRATGYIPNSTDGYVIGENLAWGTYQLSTPQAIVSAWIASPGHLANILETQYTETGIGVTPAVPASLAPGAPGATYAQEFGVIIE